MASLFASLKERLLGQSGPTDRDQEPCIPPPPEPPRDLCSTTKRRPLRAANLQDSSEEEQMNPISLNAGPATSRSDECIDLLDDLGGSLTPSTPGSSDTLGISFMKLHQMAECANCCELPSPMLDDVPLPPPAEFDSDECKRVIEKYCPITDNPSKKSLEALKKRLSEQVRSMKTALKRVSGNANAANRDGNDTANKPLPPLDILFKAVDRGKLGVLGKQPAVRCDFPTGAELESIRGQIEAKQARIKGFGEKVRKLKQFQQNMSRLTNGQDSRGNFMLLDAEASAQAAKLNQYREAYAIMVSAKMEWEMYFAQMLSVISNQGIAPKLRSDMNRFARDPPTFTKVLWSLMTAAMALDENDIHFYQNDTPPDATRECPDSCSVEKEASGQDGTRDRNAAGLSDLLEGHPEIMQRELSSTSEAHCTDASETFDNWDGDEDINRISAWGSFEMPARKFGGEEGFSSDSGSTENCVCPEPKDATPLDALKNVLLVTKSSVEEVAEDLRIIECSVNSWSQGLLGILEGLDG